MEGLFTICDTPLLVDRAALVTGFWIWLVEFGFELAGGVDVQAEELAFFGGAGEGEIVAADAAAEGLDGDWDCGAEGSR